MVQWVRRLGLAQRLVFHAEYVVGGLDDDGSNFPQSII